MRLIYFTIRQYPIFFADDNQVHHEYQYQIQSPHLIIQIQAFPTSGTVAPLNAKPTV